MVDQSGKPVILSGCNLGNWLMIEPWMLGGCLEAQDQGQITDIVRQRFGDERGYGLMELYRASYITPRDFELIKSFRFNVVRVPFDYRLLQDEKPPYAMRPDAFKWLDCALQLAEQAGVYVILDMHGVPSGQSNQMHTGRSNQTPEIYEDPAAQQRMLELWTAIARRYKDRGVIAAYDIVNEPYGDYKTDVSVPLRKLMFRAYEAVRSTGDQHLVLFPSTLGQGIFLYGDVRGRGLKQYGFTDHFYPGLFGSPSTILSHARTIRREFARIEEYLEQQQAPFLAGEFNVVLDRCGGATMMRRYYDECAARGWMATMWSYKLVKPEAGSGGDSWHLVTNAEPLPKIDLKNDSFESIESFMRSMATAPLVADEPLRRALTDPHIKSFELPKLPDLPTSAPQSQSVDGWTGVPVNTTAACGIAGQDGRLLLTAGGDDIFNTTDSFYFLQRPAPSEDYLLTATVTELLESAVHAKAGLMVRLGRPEDPSFASAAFAMVNVFPDGTVALLTRERAGVAAKEIKRFPGPLPRRIGLLKRGERVQGLVEDGAGGWVMLGEMALPSMSKRESRIGVAVCSHQGSLLTSAQLDDLKLTEGSATIGTLRISDGLQPRLSADVNTGLALKPHWAGWGPLESAAAQDNAAPTVQVPANTGVWQDIKVRPGQRYRFSVPAERNGAAQPGLGNVELRLESILDGKQVTVASTEFDLQWLEGAGHHWSTLVVTGQAMSDTLRVLIVVNPSPSRRKDRSPQCAVTLHLDHAALVTSDR